MRTLILIVTRACNLRCSYCPTVKDGWPTLSTADALRALELYTSSYGGGDIKLFGGEPLLAPEVVQAVLERAEKEPRVSRVYLSTNGLGLDQGWLDRVKSLPKTILTISLDGRAEDNRRFRRPLPSVGDAYSHLLTLLPALRETPRVVVTQTIPPATAGAALQNFEHLLELGFTRFNFLPGYYLPWRDEQLASLRESFAGIARRIREGWARREPLYVRNLFTLAPTPFFNTGVVVDSDRSIHPSNIGLSGALSEHATATKLGDLDQPPSWDAVARGERDTRQLLERVLPEHVWSSTLAVDQELTRFCRGLYPAFLDYRKQRRAA
jgi:sulfatase maturation enzyme AslB (radical SAM superfamily)